MMEEEKALGFVVIVVPWEELEWRVMQVAVGCYDMNITCDLYM